MDEKINIHANAVQILGHGVLLLGPTASGKSDLSLRLLHFTSALLPKPCALISDDQTVLKKAGDKLIASPPPQLAGRMEVRGVGVLHFDHLEAGEIALALSLTTDTAPERIPDLHAQHSEFLGVRIPTIPHAPFEASAPEKAISIVKALKGGLLKNNI